MPLLTKRARGLIATPGWDSVRRCGYRKDWLGTSLRQVRPDGNQPGFPG
jgi:hypothetical protein